MSLPEDQKSCTPFKNMDIKSLFLAASSRKRKATSPIPPITEAKNLKTCESDNEVEILDTTIGGDTKENKDLNTIINDPVSASIKESENAYKDCNGNVSGEEMSAKESSEELNSSISGLNTSTISEGNPDGTEIVKNASAECDKSESKTVNIVEKPNTKKRKRMTPEEAKQRAEEREKKQQEKLLKKQELEAKKLEREREFQQRKLQKELEKKQKEEERKEKERQRLEKKEQDEKEKQLKAEERESQKKVRQMMIEQKLEIRKQKEEMRLQQEEERKKAEEEKKKLELEKEQKEKEKREKAKAAFKKFFRMENPAQKKTSEPESAFKLFQKSEFMTLAPVIPTVSQERFNREIFEEVLLAQCNEELYISRLKSGSYRPVRLGKKERKPQLTDVDVIILDKSEEININLQHKLLQFCENVRPPYYGTWLKKSKIARPRNPFGKDTNFLDYEVDSEEEWDEGGPGESLSGTEPEDESEDDYEVDNEFFVPHGYLSAEEEKEEDEEGKDDVVNDPEKQKALLRKKLQEFEQERKKKTTELKPIIVGCYIENGTPQNEELLPFLEPYSVVFLTDSPITTSFTVKLQQELKSAASSPVSSTNSAHKSKKCAVPEEAMPYLVRLVHRNTRGMAFLIQEFQQFWQQHCQSNKETPPENLASAVPESPISTMDSQISKRQLTITIRQIATFGKPQSGEVIKKFAWWVNEDVLMKYGLTDESYSWNYVTPLNKEEPTEVVPPVVKPLNASIKDFLSP